MPQVGRCREAGTEKKRVLFANASFVKSCFDKGIVDQADAGNTSTANLTYLARCLVMASQIEIHLQSVQVAVLGLRKDPLVGIPPNYCFEAC